MKNLLFSCLGLFCCLTMVDAQDQQNQNPTEDISIQGQFETLIRKSTNYRQNGKRYEVVRLIELNALQKNVLDSLKTGNSTISS